MSKHLTLSGLQTVLPPIKHLIDKKAENIDWNENDPNAKGFIRNRPFYEEKGTQILLEEDFTLVDSPEIPVNKIPLIPGQEYCVIFNGTKYQTIAQESGLGLVFIGNPLPFGFPTSTVPFTVATSTIEGYSMIMSINLETSSPSMEPFSITISTTGTIIKKIDPKFLPEFQGNQIGKAGDAEGAEIFNDYSSNEATGKFSHVEGHNNIAGGLYSHAEGKGTTTYRNCSHTEGVGTTACSSYSHAEGYFCTTGEHTSPTSGYGAHAEGYYTIATGTGAHAEGQRSKSTSQASHAEGLETESSSLATHAEGYMTKAIGSTAHAEGEATEASGNACHAEGERTLASGRNSHAEGYKTQAKGWYSHAQGYYTIANNKSVFAAGECNFLPPEDYKYIIEEVDNFSDALTSECYKIIGEINFDENTGTFNFELESELTTIANLTIGDKYIQKNNASIKTEYREVVTKTSPSALYKIYRSVSPAERRGKYAFTVGNGTTEYSRSNAHTLDWSGNAWYQGDVYVGGSGQDDTAAKILVAAPLTASVGQTIIVKAVDTNGRPTEWEAVNIVTENRVNELIATALANIRNGEEVSY